MRLSFIPAAALFLFGCMSGHFLGRLWCSDVSPEKPLPTRPSPSAVVATGGHERGSSSESPLGISSKGFFYLRTPFLAADDGGFFAFPPAIKRVWIDVGTHARAGVTRPALDLPENGDLFIIGFEPMRYQYGEISTPKLDDYGYGHVRMAVMNAAVSSVRGSVTFHRSANNMCSSILKSAPGSACEAQVVDVEVASLPLEDVFARIRPELIIEFVKIDAQGADFEVLKSAGESLSRAKKYQVSFFSF